jgi:hypothetical protein
MHHGPVARKIWQQFELLSQEYLNNNGR